MGANHQHIDILDHGFEELLKHEGFVQVDNGELIIHPMLMNLVVILQWIYHHMEI
jgi:hypothetical protein